MNFDEARFDGQRLSRNVFHIHRRHRDENGRKDRTDIVGPVGAIPPAQATFRDAIRIPASWHVRVLDNRHLGPRRSFLALTLGTTARLCDPHFKGEVACLPLDGSATGSTVATALPRQQPAACWMGVEPVRDVPAHGHDPSLACGLDIIYRELDYLARKPFSTVVRLGVGVIERDRVAVDPVVGKSDEVSVDGKCVAAGIRFMSEDLRHGSRIRSAAIDSGVAGFQPCENHLIRVLCVVG